MRQPFLAAVSCHATKKLGNLNVLYKKNEEPRRAKTLPNVKFLKDLLSHVTKTSEGKVVFNFGIRLRHMKTENIPGGEKKKQKYIVD